MRSFLEVSFVNGPPIMLLIMFHAYEKYQVQYCTYKKWVPGRLLYYTI